MARIAALSGAGSFSQAVTTWDKSGLTGLKFVSPFVSHRQNSLVKYGGERGIRTPDTAFDRITV